MSARKRILSWKQNWSARQPGGRWYKYVDGGIKYFGHASSPDDAPARRNAERNYYAFMRERENRRPVDIRVSDATVSQICEKYLQGLEARHLRGEISATHVDHTRCSLQDFAAVIGSGKRLACIGELDLDGYRNHTLSLPLSPHTGRNISVPTAKGRLKAVRAFFRWAWKLHIVENLPRNIDDIARLPNGSTEPVVQTFTDEELKALWKNAEPRTRCFIALAINCGMGQLDISDLRANEVDWQNGYVERKRSKTGIMSKHKLWPVTLRLIQEHRRPNAREEDRLFLNGNDLPLVRRWLENGQLKHSDAIKNAFDRLLLKVGIDGHRHFYCLRKTGASIVESIDPLATSMYLSHSEQEMKRHYAQRDWPRLERALAEMEQRLPFLKKNPTETHDSRKS